MPVAKSISRLPSTSSMIAPEALAVTIGWMLNTACGTAAARRSNHSRDLGPGTSVTSLRSCGMSTCWRLLVRMASVSHEARGGSEPALPLRSAHVRGLSHHVRHAQPEAGGHAVRQVEPEPLRRARRERRQDDLGERPVVADRVVDREHRVRVADLALDLDL